MATPYLQFRHEEVTSTQDAARDLLDELPVVVIARRQTGGRGRSGSEWLSAPQALAVSVAYLEGEADSRPISLVAGVAAARAIGGVELKWPNDVMRGDEKVGGILVERSGSQVVAGLGLNLWWPEPPAGVGAVFAEDPGSDLHSRIGALWAAELLALIAERGWPAEEYRSLCSTLGRQIEWEPDGGGMAVGVDADGALVVETEDGARTISAGAVRHVRPQH